MSAAEATADGGMFRALRVHNYRRYASANLVSQTGTWMQRIGQDWLVLQLSDDSGMALGLVTALQFAPTVLLSPYEIGRASGPAAAAPAGPTPHHSDHDDRAQGRPTGPAGQDPPDTP